MGIKIQIHYEIQDDTAHEFILMMKVLYPQEQKIAQIFNKS